MKAVVLEALQGDRQQLQPVAVLQEASHLVKVVTSHITSVSHVLTFQVCRNSDFANM